MASPNSEHRISLLLADVGGTLVDSKKRLTERAKAAVKRVVEMGIKFAITSGRPPRGMKMITEAIPINTPIAAFNGGVFVRPEDFSVLESYTIDRSIAEQVIAKIDELGLDVWVYSGLDWFIRDFNAPHRDKEERTVQFPPTVTQNFDRALAEGVVKIVGVSDDLELVARAEKAVRDEFEEHLHAKQSSPSRDEHPGVSAARSQPYYLDVTHAKANKGSVVEMLSKSLGIPTEEICTFGDMPNDVLMFRKSGISIAMGQANGEVKKSATYVTDGLDDEGFAKGLERYVIKQGSSDK